MKSRRVALKVLSVEQSEGVGARVRRSIGRPELRNFDPFLMLDEFKVTPPAGFPDHPHRGFETVTYMLDGVFEHEDFCGHRGVIKPGDLQWMTAGKGIVHAEMPAADENGEFPVSHGLQLWINLKSKDKMCEPGYQELPAKRVPLADNGAGVTCKVIAGEAFGTESPVYTKTPAHYLHFLMEPNTEFFHPIPANWNSFLYVLDGSVSVGSGEVKCEPHYTVTLTRGEDETGVIVKSGDSKASVALLAGEPTGEPIVQYGPIVMNTNQEIHEAFRDYQSGRNGFERAAGWRSEISQRKYH